MRRGETEAEMNQRGSDLGIAQKVLGRSSFFSLHSRVGLKILAATVRCGQNYFLPVSLCSFSEKS